MVGRGLPSASCLWTEILSPSRTSLWCCCQQPPPGPLPQRWKLIFPAQLLVSNTSSPLNLKQENEDHPPQLLLRAADRGKWEQGNTWRAKRKISLTEAYYPARIFSVVIVHNHCCKIWEGKDHYRMLCLFYFSNTKPRTLCIDLNTQNSLSLNPVLIKISLKSWAWLTSISYILHF